MRPGSEAGTRTRKARTGHPVVAMVGAGQLARMTHEAAIRLGVELRVLAASEEDPAARAGASHLIGKPDSIEAVRSIAQGADVLTFDHEHVPTGLLEQLELEGVRVAPSRTAKLMAQDKLYARRRLHALGYPVPPFLHVREPEAADAFIREHGLPLIAKTPRGGYDGSGVWALADLDELNQLIESVPDGLILEPEIQIRAELSVLVARSVNGERVTYPVAETFQRDAMCREILAPAEVLPSIASRASALAVDIAEDIGATGVLALELFLTDDGLLVNELALRPHNSGHFTIEGCATSQFEQHLRAVLGLPLGLPSLIAPAVATVNVIGNADGSDPADRLGRALAVPGAHVHLYGKAARPGRKLGHVTVCGQDHEPVLAAAKLAAGALEGGDR